MIEEHNVELMILKKATRKERKTIIKIIVVIVYSTDTNIYPIYAEFDSKIIINVINNNNN